MAQILPNYARREYWYRSDYQCASANASITNCSGSASSQPNAYAGDSTASYGYFNAEKPHD
jgi:hypothetical protein